MIDWVINFQLNSLIGVLLYWVPLSICVYGYTARTLVNYLLDVKVREEDTEHYSPTDTVGSLIGRGLVSILPIANLWAASFDVAPEVFRTAWKWIEDAFDIPLVPKSKKEGHE